MEALGHYGSTEVELVYGPLDGLVHELSNHPLANSRFWLSLASGQKAWYQYTYDYNRSRAIAYYVGTTK